MGKQEKIRKIVPHLGGNMGITHTDEGLLNWAIENLSVKTMLDVGAGVGGQVKLAMEKGIKAIGVDGDYLSEKERYRKDERGDGDFWDEVPMIIHDYTKGPCKMLEEDYDLCWCVEFLEHVEEKYMDNYMDSFKRCEFVICTASTKNGWHHVNVKEAKYWIDRFDSYGFDFKPDLTREMKNHSTMKREFIRKTGKLFLRR